MQVQAWDEDTQAPSIETVEQVMRYEDRPIMRLTIGAADGSLSDDIMTTDDHPFYVEGKGWVPVAELEVGVTGVSDCLNSQGGMSCFCKTMAWVSRPFLAL